MKNLKYFTEEESKFEKEFLFLQAVLGLQSCIKKADVCEILEDIWNIAQERKKE